MQWKTIEADGCTWDVRSVASPADMGMTVADELLEFATSAVNMPPRRILVPAGSLAAMDEAALRLAYLKARPIGGDHYGRPGKRMGDTR
jgi:hypothetical protein